MSLEKRWALRRFGGVGRVSIEVRVLSFRTVRWLLPASKSGVTNTALHDALGLRKQEPDHAAGSDAREA